MPRSMESCGRSGTSSPPTLARRPACFTQPPTCSCLTAPAWSDSAGNNADDDADADNCRYFDLLTLLPGDDADVDLFFYGVNTAEFSVSVACVMCLNVVLSASLYVSKRGAY